MSTLFILNFIASFTTNSTGPATCLASRYPTGGLVMERVEVGIRHHNIAAVDEVVYSFHLLELYQPLWVVSGLNVSTSIGLGDAYL
jgi:hypothetical protein